MCLIFFTFGHRSPQGSGPNAQPLYTWDEFGFRVEEEDGPEDCSSKLLSIPFVEVFSSTFCSYRYGLDFKTFPSQIFLPLCESFRVIIIPILIVDNEHDPPQSPRRRVQWAVELQLGNWENLKLDGRLDKLVRAGR